jgi:ABC-2 type transport system permease protein
MSGKLREVVRYELSYQLRRPATWLYAAVPVALLFQMVTHGLDGDPQSGETLMNSAFLTAMHSLVGTLMTLLPLAAVTGEAAARDVQAGMTPLAYTAPVSKATYLGGRWLAALALAALLTLAIPVGLLVPVLVSGQGADVVGPLRLQYYLGAYLMVALPSAIVVTSAGFAVATLARRQMASFGAVALLFLTSVGLLFIASLRFNLWTAASLLDPLGLTTLLELTQSWTPAAKRTGFPYFESRYLLNRAIWLGVAAALLALAHRRFRFVHHVAGAGRTRDAARDVARDVASEATTPVPARVRAEPRRFGARTRARQLATIARESWRVVVLGWGGLAMLAIAGLVAVLGPELMEHIGVPLVPVTAHIVDYLMAPSELPTMVPLLLIAYYAGELVWRDRDAGMGEIAGAAPVADSTYLLGRAAGLALALATFQAMLMLATISVQLRMGLRDVEPWLHARLFLGFHLADYLLFVALAVVVHVVVAHKYLGHGVMLLVYGYVTFAATLGIEHRLLVFTSDPGWSYTDMRGFGRTVGPWLTFELYWAAWVALLLVAGALLWPRGTEAATSARLREARTRLTPRAIGVAAGALAAVLAFGGFAFYNTNVLNDYGTAQERAEAAAEYERRYARFAEVPQPRIDGVRLNAELYPSRGTAEMRVSYRLLHDGPAPVESLHVSMIPGTTTVGAMSLDRAATTVVADDAHGYRIIALREPLQPGDSARLDFTVRIGGRGFTNQGVDGRVVPNGTYLRNGGLPSIGYRPDLELADAAERRDLGLPPRARTPSLDDTAAINSLARAGAHRITFEATVGTEAGQRAVAPGALVRTWTERGRSYHEYRTAQRITNDYALFSARYAVHAGKWRDVDLEVVHHPRHAWNADGMLTAMRASLEHLTAELGPYPHAQLRLVEHPGGDPTLHAYPINVSFEETFALFDTKKDQRDVDFAFAIAAHEVSHQWWGHQLSPARVEGAPLMSESLAWYSAMGVVEAHYGRAHLDRLLGLMREAYLPPRAPSDPPLLQANSWFLAYRKGPLALFALREYVGRAQVNVALRRLLERHRAGTPPLATTRDLYRELEAVTPDSLRTLLHDLLAANTAWELKVEKVTSTPVGDGLARLDFDLTARKITIDTAGTITEVPMDDPIEIGAYAEEPGRRGPEVYRRMHRVRSGLHRMSITVPATASHVVVDPRQLLFDFEPWDNGREIGEERRATFSSR